MANTPNYTATKEDSRPYRTVQDAQGDALDQAALTSQAALAAATNSTRGGYGGVIIGGTFSVAGTGTQQLTAVVVPGVKGLGVTWTSSDPAKATVNASTGLVTGVAAGTTVITATSIENPAVKSTIVFTRT